MNDGCTARPRSHAEEMDSPPGMGWGMEATSDGRRVRAIRLDGLRDGGDE